jgi:ATP-dependent helicase/nuclease subunit B
VVAEPALAAGFAAINGRASAHLTPFDGLVGALGGLGLDAQNPVSPTALETWANCPFRYLLANVLRVRDVPRPEDVDTISPLDRGTLVHSVLEEFVRRAPTRTSPEQRWTPEEHDLLARIAVDHCDRAEAAGLTGHPRRWTLERRRLVRELSTVLEQDEQFRRELGVVPLVGGLEHAFGIDGGDPAVEISLPDGRTVAFRGRVDRIDASPDGARAVVWDYKTGSRSRVKADDPVDAGTLLQLPVYAHAAATATGASDVHAYYWMTRAGKLDGYQVDDGVDTRFEEVVALMLAGIDSGVFPADPGDVRFDAAGRETWDNCCYCPYDRICPPDRDRAFGRKHDDPALDAYFDLVPAPDHADGEVRS